MSGGQPETSTSTTTDDGQPEKVSRNVYVTFALCFTWGLAESIWASSILSSWLYLLANGHKANYNSQETGTQYFTGIFAVFILFKIRNHANLTSKANANTIVGKIEAFQGLAGMFTALPIGYLGDKYGREPLCKIGGIGYLFTMLLTLYAVSSHSGDETATYELYLLAGCLALWGMFQGVFSGPLQALFADSVPKGQRSKYYMYLQNCYYVPSLLGPLISIYLFTRFGNNWTFEELKLPFMIGVMLESPAGFLALLVRDDLALKEEDDETRNAEEAKLESEDVEKQDSSVSNGPKLEYTLLGINFTKASIPYILLASDIIYAIGSGMTIKFFPLFFMNELKLKPTTVQLISLLVTLLLIGFGFMSQKLSTYLGRVAVVILCRVIGICLLASLSLLFRHNLAGNFVLVVLYLLRTGFMNCCYPLDESILMDNVKKSERSTWKSLESITTVGWCGSAWLGGYLADKFSYDYSFIVTAGIQAFGCLIYCLIYPLVADEVKKEDTVPSRSDTDSTSQVDEDKPPAKTHHFDTSKEFVENELVAPLLEKDD